MRYVEECVRDRQTGHRRKYNTAHALCVLEYLGFKHTHGICNVYCFSTAKVVSRTRLYIRFRRKLYAFLYIFYMYYIHTYICYIYIYIFHFSSKSAKCFG